MCFALLFVLSCRMIGKIALSFSLSLSLVFLAVFALYYLWNWGIHQIRTFPCSLWKEAASTRFRHLSSLNVSSILHLVDRRETGRRPQLRGTIRNIRKVVWGGCSVCRYLCLKFCLHSFGYRFRRIFKLSAYILFKIASCMWFKADLTFNPSNPELNPIWYLLALLGAHYFLHVSRIMVKSLTFRLLMSYIYGAPILDVSRSHTTTQHSR